MLELNTEFLFNFCRKYLSFPAQEVLDFRSLVIGTSVNHVVGDEFLLAVACKCTLGNTKELAHILVVKQLVTLKSGRLPVHAVQPVIYPVKPFHYLMEYHLECLPVYLYHNDNRKAFDMAEQLIKDVDASGSYALYPHEKYVAAWSVETKFGSESFFEIANSVDDTPGRDSWGYLLNWYGYQKGFVTQKYAEQMLADPGDVRGQLLEENKYAGKTVWWLYKLRGTDMKTAPLECNNVVLRLSEVYLIAAEAGCKLGGDAAVQGLGYLNDIVKRGNPENEVTMADYTLDRVLDERSKELVGEGHRFFDLLRNGKTIIRKGGYHLPSVDEEVDWDFYKCVLPIPEDQFIFSPEMEQNPGYPKS